MSSRTDSLMPTYARFPEEMIRGEGMWLHDRAGRRYLDFYAGIGVSALGHGHPHLVTALKTQADGLWHLSNLFPIAGQARLAARMTADCFADVAFFCNSGVEALEALIKLGRRFHHVGGHSERWRTITVGGAFHGRSLATIAAAGNPKYLDGFGAPADGFDSVPFGNMNALRAAITPETAAILVEPVQGEGGVRPAALDYLRGLRAAADEFGLLLLLDEVQSGNGRTGRMWAHQWADIQPDAMATAKGLGGGFPIGAVLATRAAARGMTPGVHGTTFGGNPLAMAAGNAVRDVLEDPAFLENVRAMADRLWTALSDLVGRHPAVFTELRGAGLMLGLRCAEETSNSTVIDALRANGLLAVGAAENVVRLLPPLILDASHVDAAVEILDKTARSITAA